VDSNSHEALAPDGSARAAVDDHGRLIELDLRAELLRHPPAVVARTVLATVGKAQESARQQAGARQQQINADIAEAREAAHRQLAEFHAFVSDLMERRSDAR
jgi:hypothetical protein